LGLWPDSRRTQEAADHCVSQTTIKNILKEEGIKPGPKRGRGTWDEFLKIHAQTLWQVDFFSKAIWTPTGLRQAFVLAFIHLGSRRVFCSPCSFQPDGRWMVRQAEALIEQARDAGLPLKYLVRDRDCMYVRDFDAAFERVGVSVEPTAPRAPNQNAFIERWIKSIQVECLNHFMVIGQKHFDHLVSCCQNFYNSLRPRQALDNRPLVGAWPEVDDPFVAGEQIVCRESLGGVLRHYERIAA
jgi:putative transposase